MKRREESLQIALVKWFATAHPDKVMFSIPNERKATPREGWRMKQMGLTPGVADLFLMHGNHLYHGMFIEMKSPSGMMQPTQMQFGEKAEVAGYRYEVYYNLNDAVMGITNYLSIKKPK